MLRSFRKNLQVAHYSKLLIMTGLSCKTRGIILQVIFMELCPFLNQNLLPLTEGHSWLLLACLFQRKSQAIVIARSSLLSSPCKNFNVAHYSKSNKGINSRLGIPAHCDEIQLQDKGHSSESYSFGVMPLFKLNI